jgi:hypothetical protein
MQYNSNSISNADQILQVKDNGVFSAWNYASRLTGGKRKHRFRGVKTRRYKRGKIGKGRRTRRV